VFKSITASLDLGLRNGVGHHSAHYDVVNDEIVYVKADDAALIETRLPYTSFVDKVFAGYCAFEQASTFFQILFVAGGGKTVNQPRSALRGVDSLPTESPGKLLCRDLVGRP